MKLLTQCFKEKLFSVLGYQSVGNWSLLAVPVPTYKPHGWQCCCFITTELGKSSDRRYTASNLEEPYSSPCRMLAWMAYRWQDKALWYQGRVSHPCHSFAWLWFLVPLGMEIPNEGLPGALFSSVQTLTGLPSCDGHSDQPARAGTFTLLTKSLSSGQGCSAENTVHTELLPGVSTNMWCTLSQSLTGLLKKVSLVERRGISLPILCLPCWLTFTCLYKTMFLIILLVQKVTLWSQIC